jgi:hypothetical protein
MLGDLLVTADTLDVAKLDGFLKKYKSFLKQDPKMFLGIFAAIGFCTPREKYKQAAGFSQVLIHKLGAKYPPAYLMAVKYNSLIENYDEALSVIESARYIEEIQKPLQKEKARIEKEARKTKK